MIQPTQSDIGRRVIYRSPDLRGYEVRGLLTSFTDAYAFVCYGSAADGATSFRDLEWECPTREERMTDKELVAAIKLAVDTLNSLCRRAGGAGICVNVERANRMPPDPGGGARYPVYRLTEASRTTDFLEREE